jgi:hypothetical protein
VNPSSRLERYASLFDTDPPTDDASGQWALDTALLETLQFVAISEAFGERAHSESLEASLSRLGQLDKVQLELGKYMFEAFGGAMYGMDLLAAGALNRSKAHVDPADMARPGAARARI